jgi:hypothetical protein
MISHLSPAPVHFLEPVGKPLAHDVQPGSLDRIEILRLFLDLVAGDLGFGRPERDHRVSQLCHTVLIGRHARLKLRRQRRPQLLSSGAELSPSGTELLAGGTELGGLLIGKPQLLLRPGGKPLFYPVTQ